MEMRRPNLAQKMWSESILTDREKLPYSDFDDFGASRSYGFKRKHLGHDMMGQVGTPVIAVESGYVEALWLEPVRRMADRDPEFR